MYLNTNSRALAPREAVGMYEKIAINVKEASRITVSPAVVLPHGPVKVSLDRRLSYSLQISIDRPPSTCIFDSLNTLTLCSIRYNSGMNTIPSTAPMRCTKYSCRWSILVGRLSHALQLYTV